MKGTLHFNILLRRSKQTAAAIILYVCCCASMQSASLGNDELTRVMAHFPGYHLLTLQERNPDLRAFLVKNLPQDNGSVVHADFNGDGHLDYAVLIRNNHSGLTKLVVVLCFANEHCRRAYSLDETDYFRELYIAAIPKGKRVSQTEAIDTKHHPRPVTLASPAVEITYFGQAKVVLYWNARKHRMDEIQTED